MAFASATFRFPPVYTTSWIPLFRVSAILDDNLLGVTMGSAFSRSSPLIHFGSRQRRRSSVASSAAPKLAFAILSSYAVITRFRIVWSACGASARALRLEQSLTSNGGSLSLNPCTSICQPCSLVVSS